MVAERTFWISAATRKQISRMYLLYVLRNKTIAAIFIQKIDFATDAISKKNY